MSELSDKELLDLACGMGALAFADLGDGATLAFARAVIAADRAKGCEPVAETVLWNKGGSGEFTEVRWLGAAPPNGASLYLRAPAALGAVGKTYCFSSLPEAQEAAKSLPDGTTIVVGPALVADGGAS